MVRYYKKNLTNLTDSIWKKWIIIGIILTFGLINVNAQQKCCYSTNSNLTASPNSYRLNLTASHADSKKNNNVYVAAVSFEKGYTVMGDAFSPFNYVKCVLKSSGNSIPQYDCESKDRPTLFLEFDLSVLPPPLPNATITATSVFIFGDKCQYVPFCTDLALKNEEESSDKISLGPLGTWPKYAIIIGGAVLGVIILVACYLVYRRNRSDQNYRDSRNITSGTGNYNDKNNRLFSPNSLLRSGGDNNDDDLLPSDDPPKNTLIQFGTTNVQRSKSFQNRNLQSTKSISKRNHNNNNDDNSGKIPSVIIEMTDNNNNKNNNYNNLERSKSHKTKRNNNNNHNHNHNHNNHNNNNDDVNRLSGYSTSDMSKTISNHDISDREWGGNLSDSNNNNTSKKHSSSLHHTKSKSRNSNEHESRSNRKSNNDNNHNNNKPKRRSTSNDRDGRRVDRTSSRRHNSHSPSPPISKSTSDLSNNKTKQKDRDSTSKVKNSRSDANLNRKKSSNNPRDLISRTDTQSTSSSSDVPLGDKLPLAVLATKLPSSDQSKLGKDSDDDDVTPLGRIGSYYDSVLNDYQNYDIDKDSDDYSTGINNISNENKNRTINDEEVPIGQLKNG